MWSLGTKALRRAEDKLKWLDQETRYKQEDRQFLIDRWRELKGSTEGAIKELTDQKLWDDPIVTQVAPLEVFYPAEDYHQEYFERNPNQPYCRAVVAPKVAKARSHFIAQLKK